MRFKIIMGICDGLHFLHEGRTEAIVHLNLKPSNILLGNNMVPKIADFGLSRLFGEEQTRILTQNVVGWIGYIAPEYHYRGEISVKSDIFSLGVLILEIVTGLKKNANSQDISSKFFIDNVRKNWIEKTYIKSKYPTLDEEYLPQVQRCIDIGLNCVQTDPNKRPVVGKIIHKLKEINGCLEKQQQPSYAFPREANLQFVKDITMNFSSEREIGRGSFGVVYKTQLKWPKLKTEPHPSELGGIDVDHRTPRLAAVAHPVRPPFVGLPSGGLLPPLRRTSSSSPPPPPPDGDFFLPPLRRLLPSLPSDGALLPPLRWRRSSSSPMARVEQELEAVKTKFLQVAVGVSELMD
ncbi:hypothetical protein PR202_ga14080 [Eleusine coracana subsp. coracana]|uniref:non-specific serine/threonine protein kinase n=1 Tax=Eleusine coracana subsp. coracana TaxID=191504 RepID=A0AAV5CGD9_ELECO|nr:hypothetical protein PR202_ga14080 [Eleusine coracana subsp. coracana]